MESIGARDLKPFAARCWVRWLRPRAGADAWLPSALAHLPDHRRVAHARAAHACA